MNIHSPTRGRHLTTKPLSFWQRSVARAFHRVLDRIDAGLDAGAIEAILPDGTFRVLGGRADGPVAHVDLNRWRALVRLMRGGSAGWYEAFEDGDWASPDPVPLFDLFMRNRLGLGRSARARGLTRLYKRLRHALRRNHRKGAAKNIMAHYDLGNDFYALWLDRTMSYSSAIFEEPISDGESLEEGQRRKLLELGKRIPLKPNRTVLEIGCGWGFAARTFAEMGHQVTAITLSPSQKLWAESHYSNVDSAPPTFLLKDYRDVEGQFDAIVSVEMVEAVGRQYWSAFLDTVKERLVSGGRAAIQFIAIADDIFEQYAASADFIQTYIFPGGMLLSESRFRALAEARGLEWRDCRHFPLHYAETLKRWRENFDAVVEAGKLPPGFDARFVRLWRYYLQYCEGGFRGGGITVAQVTLVKSAARASR